MILIGIITVSIFHVLKHRVQMNLDFTQLISCLNCWDRLQFRIDQIIWRNRKQYVLPNFARLEIIWNLKYWNWPRRKKLKHFRSPVFYVIASDTWKKWFWNQINLKFIIISAASICLFDLFSGFGLATIFVCKSQLNNYFKLFTNTKRKIGV